MKKNILLQKLLQKNKKYATIYKKNALMKLIVSNKMNSKKTRDALLACIQTFSDYFQKVVMLRNVFCEDPHFLRTTQEHLKEEFLHNDSLMRARKNKPAKWDPILEATSSWFAWKMLSLNEQEKTLLIHFVLETSANLFFQRAVNSMKKYDEIEYFKIHSEVDEAHEKMGVTLLQNITKQSLPRMLILLQQGWDVLNAACNRIAELTL